MAYPPLIFWLTFSKFICGGEANDYWPYIWLLTSSTFIKEKQNKKNLKSLSVK